MGFVVTFLGVYLLNVSRYDPTGTSLNQPTVNRRTIDGMLNQPRSSLNPTRLSMSSDRSLPLYHQSSTVITGRQKPNIYGRSQDSVLFEAFPEEAVGLTMMHGDGSDGSDGSEGDDNDTTHRQPERQRLVQPSRQTVQTQLSPRDHQERLRSPRSAATELGGRRTNSPGQ